MVIADVSDPVGCSFLFSRNDPGPADSIFGEKFYELLLNSLKPGGLICVLKC